MDLVQVFGQVVIRVGVMIIVVIVFVVIIRVVNDAPIAGIGVRRQFVVVTIFVLFMQFGTAGRGRTFPFATSPAATTTATAFAARLVVCGTFRKLRRRVEVIGVVDDFHVLKAVGLLRFEVVGRMEFVVHVRAIDFGTARVAARFRRASAVATARIARSAIRLAATGLTSIRFTPSCFTPSCFTPSCFTAFTAFTVFRTTTTTTAATSSATATTLRI